MFFFPFIEVLSERFSVNASGGGGAAFICYCWVVFLWESFGQKKD